MRLAAVLFFILCMSCVSVESKAGESLCNDKKIVIWGVNYEYNTFYDKDELDCIGTLTVRISYPKGMKGLYFGRTAKHTLEGSRLFISAKQAVDVLENGGEAVVVIPDMSWGVYFKAWGSFEDDSQDWSVSETDCTNNYMNVDDIHTILGQYASIDEDTVDRPHCRMMDNRLLIETTGDTKIDVYDITGTLILSCKVCSNAQLDIPDINSNFLIVKLGYGNKILVTKIYK